MSLSEEETLRLIEKLDSGQATDEEFKLAVQACKNGLKEIDDHLTAKDWVWVDQSQELFGKRDFARELELWEKKLKEKKAEFKDMKKCKSFEKLKIGKFIQEIEKNIDRIKKDWEEFNKPKVIQEDPVDWAKPTG